MGKSERKNKSVSFNLSNERELKLFKHATRINPLTLDTGKPESINFSDYIKELIADDIRRVENDGGSIVQRVIDDEPIVSKKKDAYTLEVMRGYL